MELYLPCPHCQQLIEIPLQETNCRIYRHGVLKQNGLQINPHCPKHVCEHLVRHGLIYGCGKPFRINSKNELEPCDYI